ncbi:MAG: hypothetical protein JW709_04800, partial [Sedimentisphaerales bacterium]|nr:hypothetical protein [Sedimentisphaerales bacterium]
GGDVDIYHFSNLHEGDIFISELLNYVGYAEMYLFPKPSSSSSEEVPLLEDEVSFESLLQEITVASYSSFLAPPYRTLDGVYSALGYSAQPDADADGIEEGTFYLVDLVVDDPMSVPNGALEPIMIANPYPDPAPEDPEELPLTTEILSYIYNSTVDNTVEIRAVKALEFGNFNTTLGIDELWLIVTVYDTVEEQERDSLMLISDILNYDFADTAKELSAMDLAAQGFTDVTSLAFNKTESNNDPNAGRLFALDRDTQTLLTLNRNVNDVDNYGAAYAFGGREGNLVQADIADYDVVSIDFDLSGNLYGIENSMDVVVWIYTDTILTEGFSPLEVIKQLSEAEYEGASFGVKFVDSDYDGVPDEYQEAFFMTMTIDESAEVHFISPDPLEGLVFALSVSPDTNADHVEGYLDETVPADGDYLLAIVGYGGGGFNYTLKVNVFNDGYSDFGNDIVLSDDFNYIPTYTNSVPVNLNDLAGLNENTYPTLPYYPIKVTGGNLTVGQEDSITINAALEVRDDVDVYVLQLQQGQELTIDIESETLFGGDEVAIDVGIYNADLEATASISNLVGGEDVLPPPQSPDPVYTIQAIYHMPNHDDVVIDPMEYNPLVNDLVGTYYIVISGASSRVDYNTPYQLKITTTTPQPIDTPPSQLVYLAFDGGIAEYLADPVTFTTLDIERPPFDLADFRLEELDREAFIATIVARVTEIYRETGLTEDEIRFTTNRQEANAADFYSTVYIGGLAPFYGLLGIADSIDRYNAHRDGNACTFSESYGYFFYQEFSDDPTVRAEQVKNMIANNISHELGHTLGLEHCTEVADFMEINNIMNYNSGEVRMGLQEFAERNSYWYQPIGYINEVDMLLRYIGSGTEMGE